MAKIVSMQGKGKFSESVIKAVKKVAKKTAKIMMTNAKLTAKRMVKRKGQANPGGRSVHHIAAPKGISRRMRKQGG